MTAEGEGRPGPDGGSAALADVVEASRAVAETSGRGEKIRHIARLLERMEGGEIAVAAAYLSGEPPAGRIGVGPATLRDVLPVEPADEPSLTLDDTEEALRRIAAVEGEGARARRRRALRGLLARATPAEQDFLARLLLGELRQGAQEGLVVEAVAEASGAPPERVRRAVMVRGEAGAVAEAALEEGPEALSTLSIRLFRPVKPMLAHTASDLDEALERLGRAAFEYKLDGARLQVHRSGDDVRIFSRRLNEKTAVLPEVVEAVRAFPVEEVVLDGEALVLDEEGRPRPFQETMRRVGRSDEPGELRRTLPLTAFFFDCLRLDGRSLLDRPASERYRALRRAVPEERLVPRLETDDPRAARDFLAEAIGSGHEGVVAKSLDVPYEAGRRGRAWLKVKETHTADLVVLGAEWGHGRRRGWLSNLHLGARVEDVDARQPAGASPYPAGWAMVGKTFKGMTDEMLDWQTARLLELERHRSGGTVFVRPELVAEVAFDGVQESPTYSAGVALRFARIRGYRDDKEPAEADTLAFLRAVRDGRRPG